MPAGISHGLWKVLVRYRAGSLDQALARFRYRNILLGGSVLLVLALGMVALIVSTERARALAQMQTEFVLGVSHELRTPLTVIRLAADNLKEGLVENSDQAHKYGEIINSQALELSNMVERALAFARTQSRAFIPNTAAVSPEHLVMTSLAACERDLQDAGMQVELDIEPSLPFIAVDVRLMNSCLENLIYNAVKYASAGRWMAIRIKKVNKPEGERVQISIEDRGPGISPTDAPHIFEPFYRGKQGDACQVPGVGLGLTLVKRVVEAHNGSIEVCSSEGVGTWFSLCLPGQQSEREAHSMVQS
jgi:signal transduction histidine kinase